MSTTWTTSSSSETATPKAETAAAVPPQAFEPRPDAHALTAGGGGSGKEGEVDYEPDPERSVELSEEQRRIVDAICGLYSAQTSEELMRVYAEKAVYDDPWSYCDTRYKIAGQWYGLPMIMASSKTLKREVVSASADEIIFKNQQEYHPKLWPTSKTVNSLISLKLDEHGKVKYHKDMWNEKDYSHEGLGKLFKNLNGDHLTKITQPPETL